MLSLSCEDFLQSFSAFTDRTLVVQVELDMRYPDSSALILRSMETLLELARKQGCERMLLLGLTLAEALLETELPEPVRERIYAELESRH